MSTHSFEVLNVISDVLLRKLIDPSFSSSYHNFPLALFSTRTSGGQTATVATVEMMKKVGALVESAVTHGKGSNGAIARPRRRSLVGAFPFTLPARPPPLSHVCWCLLQAEEF